MAIIRIIEKHEELNSLGCEFFLKTNESHTTRVTSTKLRWLSIRNGKGEFITPVQKDACSFLEATAEKYGSDDWDKLNLKILLYENPIYTQDSFIKCLLKCGADIRYFHTTDCTKVVIQDNIVYLTFASSFKKVVNSGVYYVGKKTDDPFVDYHKQQFDLKFNKGKKITLKNDNIVYADKFLSRFNSELKDVGMKEWIILILGALFGGVISIIVGLLL